MKLKAIGKMVIVDQEEELSSTESGLFIAGDVRSFRRGIVRSVGPDVEGYSPGDKVIYVREASEEIVVDEGLPSELRVTVVYNFDHIYVKVID